ncbi:aminomethyl-transferring glycine dehydrogenase subunit GcvPA [Capillibacterium thermochitinicola]|uniref:Probable glycine dehydrogenase (decarboxylating) subunit 1 n=1 Tax=Capillibacterium thermochitinicola TaxID=2699427 RepID=A0A8J6LIN5_9FIRM|nr:aminomethyl-transferring glycine dehydrogenase subunit GcvPA [Capillibacterium thermochitinicola]MBA2133235.1 aminomethyl-transferring glycine dehydrogenase subunit GcvPA [Capillibacterium thermochitinicola]
MGHPYLPLTDQERRQMAKVIGIQDESELFATIPVTIRAKAAFDLSARNEWEVKRLFTRWAAENTPVSQLISFLGAGAYEHAIPSALPFLVNRSEFLTAYTPYQPEFSQGLLQAFFEYQSLVADLTGMDVANASMYDGPTALAEAVLLAHNVSNRKEFIVLSGLNPEAQQVLRTYTAHLPVKMHFMAPQEQEPEVKSQLATLLSDQTAAVVLQYPDFFGRLRLTRDLLSLIKESGALSIVYLNDPICLGLLEPPGTMGADLVVGEAQSFGLPLSFGGPYLGFFAAKKDFLRNMPGRLVGKTTDLDGKEGFVLTLQTREQHIRREKATSNICTNQALCAITATIYLSLLGPTGLKEVALSTVRNSHYLYSQLTRIPAVQGLSLEPFFHEFVIGLPTTDESFIPKMKEKGFLPGYRLPSGQPFSTNAYLLYTSELRTKAEMDRFCEEIERCVQ